MPITTALDVASELNLPSAQYSGGTTADRGYLDNNWDTVSKKLQLRVKRGATDAASGDNLRALYTAAKTLTPGGNALSATNRAVIILPVGRYDMGNSTFTVDNAYIDFAAEVMPNPWAVFKGQAPPTVIYQAGGGRCDVTQTVDGPRFSGLDFHNAGTTMSTATGGTGYRDSDNALRITCTITTSQYHACGFYAGTYADEPTLHRYGITGVVIEPGYDLGGYWDHCYSTPYAWRIGPDRTINATMRYCNGGYASFGGDSARANISGIFDHCVAGSHSFGGCSAQGMVVAASARFYWCVAGDLSYGLGQRFDGQAYHCIGGLDCFGGTSHQGVNLPGTIGSNAVIEECYSSGGYSFGAQIPQATGMPYMTSGLNGSPIDFAHMTFGVKGILRRCACPAMEGALLLSGGTVDSCDFVHTTAGIDAFNCLVAGSTVFGGRHIAGSGGVLCNNFHKFVLGATTSGQVFYGSGAAGTNLPSLPANIEPGSVVIRFTKGGVNYTATDDGEGDWTGDVDGVYPHSINYVTGVYQVKLSLGPNYDALPTLECKIATGSDINIGKVVAVPETIDASLTNGYTI